MGRHKGRLDSVKGATMTSTAFSNPRKMYLTTAGILAFGVAAYGLGRVYPPLGPSEGTVGPADRYVSAQVGEGDVTLGDTSVAELMQTDAFELMVHDANFRALAASPGFQALAGQPQVLAAVMANPQAFSALAKDRNAFAGIAQAAHNASSLAPQAHQASAALLSAVAGHSAALQALAAHPQALAMIANNASAFANAASPPGVPIPYPNAQISSSAAFQQLAGDKNAMHALAKDPGVFSAIAANAASWKA